MRPEGQQRSEADGDCCRMPDASPLPPPACRRLILTADDYGLDEAVNEAVERAHVEGVLTAASLMVAAPAAADAVARARRLPRLGVGLHLVLADGPAASAADAIPALVDAEGRFGDRMVRDGFRFFFSARVRRQLAVEIRAQFTAFRATGLALDHVDAHKHFQLHPTVLGLVLEIGRDFGLRAMRLPFEPGTARWLGPWQGLTRARLRAAGVRHNDAMFGLSTTGATDEPALLAALDRLPPGLSEIYLHPATRRDLTATMASYRHDDELAALCAPSVRARLAGRGIVTGRWADFHAP